MPEFTLKPSRTFPPGTEVEIYPKSNWPAWVLFPSGAPVGSASDSDTMGDDGVTFDLPYGEYYAYANPDDDVHVYMAVSHPEPRAEDKGKGVVIHGSNASAARPSGYASIEWIGSVEPSNAENNDTWIDTSEE